MHFFEIYSNTQAFWGIASHTFKKNTYLTQVWPLNGVTCGWTSKKCIMDYPYVWSSMIMWLMRAKAVLTTLNINKCSQSFSWAALIMTS